QALVLRALPEVGQFVVKNGHGNLYDLDERSYFLLGQLDGRASPEEVCAAYQVQFGESLTAEELAEFVDTARELGLLEEAPAPTREGPRKEAQTAPTPRSSPAQESSAPSGNNLLHFRMRLIDPDRLLTGRAPKLCFFWTPAFVLLAAACIVAASVVAWDRRAALAHSFTDALAWRTVVLAWVVVGAVTVLHEFAHGLTCKRHG